jgi:hypothetical protein
MDKAAADDASMTDASVVDSKREEDIIVGT